MKTSAYPNRSGEAVAKFEVWAGRNVFVQQEYRLGRSYALLVITGFRNGAVTTQSLADITKLVNNHSGFCQLGWSRLLNRWMAQYGAQYRSAFLTFANGGGVITMATHDTLARHDGHLYYNDVCLDCGFHVKEAVCECPCHQSPPMTCKTCGAPCVSCEGYDGNCNACTYATVPAGYAVRLERRRAGQYIVYLQNRRIIVPDRVYGGTMYMAFNDEKEAVAYCVDHAHGAVEG